MKAKISPLKWLDFALLKFNFEFIHPTELPKNEQINPISDYFERYPIDIDFSIINQQSPNEIQVFVKITINDNKPLLPGYHIFIEGAGLFKVENYNTIKQDQFDNLKNYSTVNLLLNKLRSIVSLQTSFSAFGAYDIPPIDIKDLFDQKRELVSKLKDNH